MEASIRTKSSSPASASSTSASQLRASRIGSDAVNKDPDYSAAYCILETNSALEGHGLGFTLGRGTDLVVQALEYPLPPTSSTAPSAPSQATDLPRLQPPSYTDDTQQFRWLGPEKGVHPPQRHRRPQQRRLQGPLRAKSENKPLHRQLLADMEPLQILSAIDFRYIDDALHPTRSTRHPRRSPTQSEKLERLGPAPAKRPYPAYTTLRRGWFRPTPKTRFAASLRKPSPKAGRTSN